MIELAFNYIDVDTLRLLYELMVRPPYPEYVATVWSPPSYIDRFEDV
jgi:hypothetical protein